ncbi:unnamed protein product [Linum trigynum]|uniref:Late embryogenesis abundant protein LEA-2 subgroup domain-containing protein n=1 Tax=Linum trigynum TaxID=586398 RepID=A0AAV2G8J4_9ROSI
MDFNSAYNSRRKPFLQCAIATTTLVAIVIVVGVTLGFTVFRPRNPTVVLYPVGLSNLTMMDLTTQQNITTKMVVGIGNENYAGFKFGDATGLVTFGDDVVGEAPILGQEIHPRSSVNITTWSVLMPAKMMSNPAAITEISSGKVELKSTVKLHGKSSFLGVKVKTSAYTECYLTIVFGEVLSGESWCWSKLKIN